MKINEHMTMFYSDLYKDEKHQKQKILVINSDGNEKPEIIPREVEWATKNLKNNKSFGPDKMSNEFFKMGGKPLVEVLIILFNKILKDTKIPKAGSNSISF